MKVAGKNIIQIGEYIMMCSPIWIIFFPATFILSDFIHIYFHIYIYIYIYIVGRVFANGSGDLGSIPGRVIPKTFKMVLDTYCLTLSNKRYISSVKWSNPGKGVVPSPTPRCSSFWKGTLLVVLDYCRQLYF